MPASEEAERRRLLLSTSSTRRENRGLSPRGQIYSSQSLTNFYGSGLSKSLFIASEKNTALIYGPGPIAS